VAETRLHPETGETLRRGVRRQSIRYGSLAREVEVPGWYPADGDDGVHSGADLAESDRVYRELRGEYSRRVREARKRLKLSQEEAGRIIGGGKRAFQKYESGATPPSDAAVGLIELLIRHPEEVETLRAIRAGEFRRAA
jgi:HTH-type transcriptional regulator/antitoxin MqsA